MAVLEEIVEQNRRVALSIITEKGYKIEVDSAYTDVLLVIDFDYLMANFDKLFVDCLDYREGDVRCPDDIWDYMADHVGNVIDYLEDDATDLCDLLLIIDSNVDYITVFNGVDLGLRFDVRLSNNEFDVLVDRLIEVKLGS